MPPTVADLIERAIAGERGALARAISILEAGAAPAEARTLPARRREGPALARASGVGRASTDAESRPTADSHSAPHVIGITGPPGAGKSTFTDRLVAAARARGERVAVVAVDPSSPWSGGAILGDRVRMDRHAEDPGVYLRSLSSRGHLGGLSRATGHVVDLLDACGYDRILVETVGVGQGELAVLQVADTVLVVLTPESGDTVQAMKAGLLEIADVFCVNKADRPGADLLRRELELGVHLDDRPWSAPVHTSVALQDVGIAEVLVSLEAHRDWNAGAGRAAWDSRRADGRVAGWLDLVAERARKEAWARLRGTPDLVALRAGTLQPEDLV